jgi:hypothetical protein
MHALAILAEAGVEPPVGAVMGVWAASIGGRGLVATPRDRGWHIHGVQPYASGASTLTHALVTADAPDGPRLFRSPRRARRPRAPRGHKQEVRGTSPWRVQRVSARPRRSACPLELSPRACAVPAASELSPAGIGVTRSRWDPRCLRAPSIRRGRPGSGAAGSGGPTRRAARHPCGPRGRSSAGARSSGRPRPPRRS